MLHYLLNATNFRSPLLRTVVPTIGAAFALQTAVGIPSVLARTERFFDLSGSVTYVSCTALSLCLPILRAKMAAGASAPSLLSLGGKVLEGANWRQLALSGCVTIWAARLGSYLFTRIIKDGGEDSRFDPIRNEPLKLFTVFMAQATWVSLCLLPVMSLNSLPATAFAGLSTSSAISNVGFLIWIFGLLYEMAADRQKTEWLRQKKEKKHAEEFLTKGLWSKSRYPNYFGEISLWAGIGIAAGGVLASPSAQIALGWAGWPLGKLVAWAIGAASPAFSALVLIKGTGVPPSQRKYDKKFGDRKDYQQWRNNTPMIIPKFW